MAISYSFAELLNKEQLKKFNPYHDSKGRFSDSGGAASFTYKPGASTAHSQAIVREKEKASAEAKVGKGFKGTLYHGSPNTDIKEFDINRAGENTSSGEKLIFFTDSKQMADDFSYERLEGSSTFFQRRGKKGRVYEVDVEMKNPLDFRNLDDKDIDNILKLDAEGLLTKDSIKSMMSNHQLLKTSLDLRAERLVEMGYDGFIANTGKAGHNSYEYAVVDAKQAKIRKSAGQLEKAMPEHVIFIGLNISGADELVMNDGEAIEDFHVTLLYGYFTPLGDEDDTHVRIQKSIASILRLIPRKLAFDRIKRFDATENSDGKDVIYAQVEKGQLERIHEKLLEKLKENRIEVRKTFPEYHPHMTLAYVDEDAMYELPDIDVTGTVTDITIDFGPKEEKEEHTRYTENVKKYNHHHDPLTGRFTSGSGGPMLAPDGGGGGGGSGSKRKKKTTGSGAGSDSNTDYSDMIRTKDPPTKTETAYKVFVVKDGKLYPPMVANHGAKDTPVGVWLDAQEGVRAPDSKTGRPQVKAGGKGTQGGSGSLAYRPGWHLGEVPEARQFARKNPETGKKELFPENFVWAECDIAADVDYQQEAMSYGYNKNGKFQHSLAGLPKLPSDGYYKYRTNPDPSTQPWYITGSMKVRRILTDDETDAVLRQKGITPMQRKGGRLDEEGLKRLGITERDFTDSNVKKSSVTYSFMEILNKKRLERLEKYNHNHDPATGRFTSGSGGGSGIAHGSETASHGTNPSQSQKSPSQTNSGAGTTTFTPASTIEEAMAYAKSQLGFENVDYSYRTDDFDWKTLDLDTVNYINESITSIQSKYPELKGVVKNLNTIQPGTQKNRYAQVRINPKTGDASLEFGMPMTKGMDSIKKDYEADLKLGYHPEGTDYKSLFWHEYGHVYAEHAVRNSGIPFRERTAARKDFTLESQWRAAAAGSRGMTDQQLSESISVYATTTPGETFAEAFAEYNCSQSPRAECIELIKQSGAAR